MRGLQFFTKTNSKGCWNLASFHSPHSMTWRWLVSFSLPASWRLRPLWYGYRVNGGVHGGIRIPFVGTVSWQTQRPMWYRDLYQRLRDQRDGLIPSDDEPPPPPRLTVVEGGYSLH